MQKKSLIDVTDASFCKDEIEVAMLGLIRHSLCEEDSPALEHSPEFYSHLFRKVGFNYFAELALVCPSVAIHQFCELMEYAGEGECRPG